MPRRTPPVSARSGTKLPATPHDFRILPDPAHLRQYPHAHHERLPITFYPAQPLRIEGDVLEIGPGRGDFLLTTAAGHPELKFVAIELGKKRHPRLVQRVQKRALSNVLLIHGDARLVVPRFFQPSTFRHVVVLFPDPWPKLRHAFNRLLQPEFLTEVARVLRPGGHLHVKSDVESYVSWVEKQVAGLPHYRIVDDCWPWGPLRSPEGKTLSLFADRQIGMGYNVYSLCLEKVETV